MHVSDLRTWGVEVEGQKFKIILCSRVGLARAWGFFQKGEEERTRNRRERGEGGGGKEVGRGQVRLQHQANHSGD